MSTLLIDLENFSYTRSRFKPSAQITRHLKRIVKFNIWELLEDILLIEGNSIDGGLNETFETYLYGMGGNLWQHYPSE